MIAVTLDSGALIAMERNRERGLMLLRAAREHRARLMTITPVVAEWWRGRTDVRERIKRAVDIVPFPASVAEATGVVLGQLGSRSERASLAIDVMVVTFAAMCADGLVYTSDVGDLETITARFFPAVRVLGV